jgi:hypothetical protein
MGTAQHDVDVPVGQRVEGPGKERQPPGRRIIPAIEWHLQILILS